MKLVVFDIPGTWYNVQAFVNKYDLAEAVVSISPWRDNYTFVALRLNFNQIAKLRQVGWIKQENL